MTWSTVTQRWQRSGAHCWEGNREHDTRDCVTIPCGLCGHSWSSCCSHCTLLMHATSTEAEAATGTSTAVHDTMKSKGHSCGPMLPSSQIIIWSMLHTSHPSWYHPKSAVLQRSCMGHLTPELHTTLHYAATPGKAIRTETQGKHAFLCSSPCDSGLVPCTSTAVQQVLFVQASLKTRLAPTSADWLRTCNRSGTMWPTPT